MAESEGVPPQGGAPSARSGEPGDGTRAAGEPSGPAAAPDAERRESRADGARPATEPPAPTDPVSGEPVTRPLADAEPADRPLADAEPDIRPLADAEPVARPLAGGLPVLDDPLAPYRPAEPTLRADPVVREFDVPVDTGQLRRISTGQLLVVHRPEYDQREVVEQLEQRRAYSWVAAVTGIIGATASLFVGWMLPLSIAAIVFGVLGLRREEHGRTLAFIGIGTGLGGLVFSALWIGYYAIVFGALPA